MQALILRGNLIYVGMGSVGLKVYGNSVLAVLNSRRSLSERMMQDFELGSFEPEYMQANPAVGPPDAPLATSTLQQGVGAPLPATAGISFASMPPRGQAGYPSGGGMFPYLGGDGERTLVYPPTANVECLSVVAEEKMHSAIRFLGSALRRSQSSCVPSRRRP
ncbi:hypothetical protein GY45DRAFT_104068 [Cubamyces sp. BRFM 1775]|nr:hypothetical protein GY45DRAFT_104068 [Cubamyces sp. BRFM 1775]